jgi:hypothetical protein
MMPLPKKTHKPRMIILVTVLLFIQIPVNIFLGLNLITHHWSFLFSLPIFWEDLQTSIQLALQTPGEVVEDEILLFNLIGFIFLILGSAAALLAGLTFHRGRPMAWILSLIAQIATLLTAIGLYFVHEPTQSYWLIAIGVLMVLYLNNADVRQWFFRSREGEVADEN